MAQMEVSLSKNGMGNIFKFCTLFAVVGLLGIENNSIDRLR
jgi:hypothetical protein